MHHLHLLPATDSSVSRCCVTSIQKDLCYNMLYPVGGFRSTTSASILKSQQIARRADSFRRYERFSNRTQRFHWPIP